MSLPWPTLTPDEWREQIAALKAENALTAAPNSSIIDLGGPGSGNFGHAGRPGEVGGSSGGDGDGGDRGAGTTSQEIRLKPDGGKIAFEPTKRPVSDAAEAYVLGLTASREDVAVGMLEGVPGDLDVSWSAVSTLDEKTGLPHTLIMLADRHDGLSVVRRFTRENDGSLVVHHDLFEVTEKDRGKGIAKALLAKSLDAYRKLGVDKIKTSANLEVGGYAWAKFGFKATDPSEMAEEMSLMLRPRAGYSGGRPGAGFLVNLPGREQILKVIEEHKDDPRLPWHVAGIVTADGRKVGKEVLLNTSWDAELDLHDTEATDRLEHYVKGK